MINTVKALTADYLAVDDSLLITGDLSVASYVNIRDKLTVSIDGSGGSIRCTSVVDNSESSIAFYKYINKRSTNAGDVWISGVNSWGSPGFSIGTNALNACLNISDVGSVSAAYKILKP